MIKFSYIKNDILFLVLSHSAGKQEFDNNIQSIKSALKFHMPEECKETLINDIKAFVTHTPIKKTVEAEQKVMRYPERATGNFSVNIEDEKLNSLVMSIQNIIKAMK
ncbi:MAG: hypothetical protein Q7S59_08820 [Sulfurimonas sp.]|nr:hypothetical protein [Sulfurimonas sp.]